jgi:mRNA-degrading endonuclease toxin of MazEF toxin-antitoxin module
VNPSRGEVWLVDFGDQGEARPVVVVSADRLNESAAGVVIVVPCTTVRRALASHVELEPARTGLDEVVFAKVEDVKSVAGRRFVRRVGSVGVEAMLELSRVLRFLLDL